LLLGYLCRSPTPPTPGAYPGGRYTPGSRTLSLLSHPCCQSAPLAPKNRGELRRLAAVPYRVNPRRGRRRGATAHKKAPAAGSRGRRLTPAGRGGLVAAQQAWYSARCSAGPRPTASAG
jgi:hypothetical protein